MVLGLVHVYEGGAILGMENSHPEFSWGPTSAFPDPGLPSASYLVSA